MCSFNLIFVEEFFFVNLSLWLFLWWETNQQPKLVSFVGHWPDSKLSLTGIVDWSCTWGTSFYFSIKIKVIILLWLQFSIWRFNFIKETLILESKSIEYAKNVQPNKESIYVLHNEKDIRLYNHPIWWVWLSVDASVVFFVLSVLNEINWMR